MSKVSRIIAFIDEFTLMEHASEDRVFVDGSILHRSFICIPDTLLVLFEPPEKKMNLHHRSPTVHVGIKVVQIGVVLDRFLVSLVSEMSGEFLSKSGFAHSNDSRNPYEHVFNLVLLGIRSSLGETCCFEVQVPQNVR